MVNSRYKLYTNVSISWRSTPNSFRSVIMVARAMLHCRLSTFVVTVAFLPDELLVVAFLERSMAPLLVITGAIE